MRKRNNTNNTDKSGKGCTCTRKPQHDKREEHDKGGLDIVIEGNTSNNNWFRVEEIEIEICQNDEQTTEECKHGGENSQSRHEEQNDEIVECVVLGIFLDAFEKFGKLRL